MPLHILHPLSCRAWLKFLFLQENGVYVTDPGKPSEKYPFLDFAGVEDFTNLDGEVGKALVYKLKDNK